MRTYLKIYDVSSKSYVNNNNYIVKSKFLLESNLIVELKKLWERKIKLGVVYGETEPELSTSLDKIDLLYSNCSHIITNITISSSKLRKLKRKKIEKSEIDKNDFNVEVEIEILNNYYGKIIKSMIDLQYIKLRCALRCIEDQATNEKKLFTVDLYPENEQIILNE